MRRALAPLLLLASASAPAESPFGEPVSDEQLAEMRGGFQLANGLDVSMAVRTETSVNGNLLLRTVYALNEGPATLSLFAPSPGEEVSTATSGASPPNAAMSGSGVSVTFDRGSGVSIAMPSPAPARIAVSNGTLDRSTDDGLTPLPIGPGGSIETAGGLVSFHELAGGARAQLDGDGIDVSHLVGDAFGSVIANSGNNRSIDTMTTIMLDIRGATPANLGASLMQVEGMALDATRGMVR